LWKLALMPWKRWALAFGDVAFGLQATQSPWKDSLTYNGRLRVCTNIQPNGRRREAVVELASVPGSAGRGAVGFGNRRRCPPVCNPKSTARLPDLSKLCTADRRLVRGIRSNGGRMREQQSWELASVRWSAVLLPLVGDVACGVTQHPVAGADHTDVQGRPKACAV